MSGSAISRHLMAAMFAVTIVPILGWSVVVDLAEHVELDRAVATSPRAKALEDGIERAKSRLVLVLGLSLVTLAGASLYLRRVLVSPLESLSDRARRASSEWTKPPECARNDEIGDLARALDSSVRELAERVERARRFAADLSHELRTPLAAIQGAAELLANEELSPNEVRRFNGNVLSESQRLGRLVEGILELERGAVRSRRDDRSEIVSGIRHVVEGLTPLANRKELSFAIDVGCEAAWTAIDSDRHNRVLFALLENALKFSPPRTAIEIALAATEMGYEISVTDRGPGVAPAQRESIFERYAQGSSAQRTGAVGGGLGLAIAKALVESWGGEIAVDERPGGGARFYYDVPASDAELNDGAAPPDRAPS